MQKYSQAKKTIESIIFIIVFGTYYLAPRLCCNNFLNQKGI